MELQCCFDLLLTDDTSKISHANVPFAPFRIIAGQFNVRFGFVRVCVFRVRFQRRCRPKSIRFYYKTCYAIRLTRTIHERSERTKKKRHSKTRTNERRIKNVTLGGAKFDKSYLYSNAPARTHARHASMRMCAHTHFAWIVKHQPNLYAPPPYILHSDSIAYCSQKFGLWGANTTIIMYKELSDGNHKRHDSIVVINKTAN